MHSYSSGDRKLAGHFQLKSVKKDISRIFIDADHGHFRTVLGGRRKPDLVTPYYGATNLYRQSPPSKQHPFGDCSTPLWPFHHHSAHEIAANAVSINA